MVSSIDVTVHVIVVLVCYEEDQNGRFVVVVPYSFVDVTYINSWFQNIGERS